MAMQIFSTLFIGGFITLAVIGHAALLHAMFLRPAEPFPEITGRHLRLVPTAHRVEFARKQIDMEAAKPALRIA